ncbi:MAG: nucleotide exchange factor GrpE [Candidatus Eisenbacteria bacterium]
MKESRDKGGLSPQAPSGGEPARGTEREAWGEAQAQAREAAVGAAHAQGPTEPAGTPDDGVPLEQHQRLLAEFDNYRKRVERDRALSERRGTANLLARLLPLVDDFGRAAAALASNREAIDRQGILIILGRLAEILEREGLTQVEATPGTRFDPEVHEAVLTIPTAQIPEGSVAEVLENGYQYGDRLLRPARVAVALPPEQRSPAEDEDTG